MIGRLTRLLARWADGRRDVPVDFPRLHLHPLREDDLFEDAFMLMARDGAGLIEVQLRLQKSLAALQRQGSAAFRQAAAAQSALALERSEVALTCESDRQRLRQEVGASNGHGLLQGRAFSAGAARFSPGSCTPAAGVRSSAGTGPGWMPSADATRSCATS